jgi:hypothetical protein
MMTCDSLCWELVPLLLPLYLPIEYAGTVDRGVDTVLFVVVIGRERRVNIESRGGSFAGSSVILDVTVLRLVIGDDTAAVLARQEDGVSGGKSM